MSLPFVLAPILALALQAGPTIRDAKLTYGYFGPECPTAEFHIQDDVCLRYTLCGLRTAHDGKTDVTTTLNIWQPDGKLFERSTATSSLELSFGGGCAPDYVRFEPGDRRWPGEWTLVVVVTDNVTGRFCRVQKKFRFLSDDLAIVRPIFYTDAACRNAAGPRAHPVGQPLYFAAEVVQCEAEDGKPKVDVEVQLLDARERPLGKPTHPKVKLESAEDSLAGPADGRCPAWPFLSDLRHDEVDEPKHGPCFPNRVGDFIIYVEVRDRITNKRTELNVPLHVVAE
jgi:hypothetical protein